MADTGNGQTPDESNGCVLGRFQGYLEKKGVLGNKTKLWCVLENSALQLEKKPGDLMLTLDLRDSHQVRKLSGDSSGTQFEICMSKKTHVFICPTSNNCTVWVKTLQSAMLFLRPSSQDQDTNEYTSDRNASLYEVSDCKLSSPETKVNIKVSEYFEPIDDQKAGSLTGKDSEYWESGTFEREDKLGTSALYYNVNTFHTVNQPGHKLANKDTEVRNRKPNGEIPPTITGESPAVQLRTSHARPNTNYTGCDVTSMADKEKGNNYILSDTHNTVQYVDVATGNSKFDLLQVPRIDEDDNSFQDLADTLDECDSPIPEFIHPLTDEDRKPIKELNKFLNNNSELCLVPCSFPPRMSEIDDPVASLRLYLKTLESVLQLLDEI